MLDTFLDELPQDWGQICPCTVLYFAQTPVKPESKETILNSSLMGDCGGGVVGLTWNQKWANLNSGFS